MVERGSDSRPPGLDGWVQGQEVDDVYGLAKVIQLASGFGSCQGGELDVPGRFGDWPGRSCLEGSFGAVEAGKE